MFSVMPAQRQASPEVYQADRPLHHNLAMAAYRESFRARNLTLRYEESEFRRLTEVFCLVQISDSVLPSVCRPVDTFDLTNPYQAARLRDACKRDLPSPTRTVACLKAIDRYCRYLKENPTLYLPGQRTLYLPQLYGPIESPVNRYSLPRRSSDERPNFKYLEASEYKVWLQYTAQRVRPNMPPESLRKAAQLHLMCVLAGETGIRLQELIGLDCEHLNLADGVLLVTKGKGNKGSGYRKRSVPLTKLTIATAKNFFAMYPRHMGEPLIQNPKGQRLSQHTASHWMRELIAEIQRKKLAMVIEPGFGWHAFRRTYTREYLDQGGNVFDLKRNTGWKFTSTISHYLGDSKQKPPRRGAPLEPLDEDGQDD